MIKLLYLRMYFKGEVLIWIRKWCSLLDSNQWPTPCHGGTLPTELSEQYLLCFGSRGILLYLLKTVNNCFIFAFCLLFFYTYSLCARYWTRTSNLCFYLKNTFPPIILKAGVPRINISLAKMVWQSGQVQDTCVKSVTMRSLKHLTNAPFPPFRYLNNAVLHFSQNISTVFTGPFLLGFAI